MSDKASFVLYGEIEEHLDGISDEDCGKLFRAILQYVNRNEVADLSGEIKMAFRFIRAQIDRVNAKYDTICERNRVNGTKGGAPKGNQNAKKQPKTTQTTQTTQNKHPDPDPEPEPDNDPDISPYSPPQAGSDAGDDDTQFDAFWKEYPKKVGKGEARKSWKRIKPNSALFDKIQTAVIQAKQSDQWRRENGRYIPNPTTWLNQGRWEDELPNSSAPPATQYGADGTAHPDGGIWMNGKQVLGVTAK